MQHKDMYSQPGYLIRRLHQRSTAEFAAATNGFSITQIQFSILLVVQDFPGIEASRISELIGSDRTTVRQALLILEQKGLIRREAGRKDRRTKALEITSAGLALADKIAPLTPDLGNAILRGITSRERKVFMRLLTKLIEQDECAGG